MRARLSLACACLGLTVIAVSPALAQPIYKDSERFSEPGFAPEPLYRGGGGYGRVPQVETGPLRPHRRLMGDATYSGSEYGLSKPSYNGIGTRPDWGRSSQ